MITGPKRIDVVLLRKSKQNRTRHLQVFEYFLEHNLVSYKSFRDRFRLRDISDCFIYYHSYLQTVKGAHRNNTTISLLISQKPRKFLEEYKSDVQELKPGFYAVQNRNIALWVINIEEIELRGEDGIFLSAFCKDLKRVKGIQEASVEKLSSKAKDKSKKVLASLGKVLDGRLYYFEGKDTMGAVADITDIVLPKLEEAEKRGIKKGRVEGIEKGKTETAHAMLRKGYPLSDITEITGLTKRQLEGIGVKGKGRKL